MRLIFVDEAGTSAKEPVTVVAGIVMDPDRHVRPAELLLEEILGGVPPQHRESFTFHATEVFNDRRYQDGWSMTDRIELLKAVMRLPSRLGMAIAVSAVWRDAMQIEAQGMTHAQFQHFQAFSDCLAIADRSIRDHAGPSEIAMVVAEDVPEMQRYLRFTAKLARENPYHYPPSHLRRTERDEEAGYLTQRGDLRITRIRDAIHFVGKADDALLQIADACAYGFRRYFAKEPFGTDFVDAILGDHGQVADFASPAGMGCWWPKA